MFIFWFLKAYPGFATTDIYVGSGLDEVALDGLYSEYFSLPVSVTLPLLFHSHIQSCTNGATKYNVDSDGFPK